jgi:hypothetical protein
MNLPSKEDTLKKWGPILDSMGMTGSKADWMSQYANAHIDNEKQIESNTDSEFPSLLPMAMKISAQTIGMDIVPVQPLSAPLMGGMSQEEREKIEAEVKQKNRDGKIDSLIEGTEYKEEKIEDHPDYKEGGGLFYIDYTYGDTSEKEEEESPILGRKKKK